MPRASSLAPARRFQLFPLPSRKERLDIAKQLLTSLRDEAQTWLDNRPDGYENTDDNADKQETIEAFKDELSEIIDNIGDLEVPRFANRNGSDAE
jgi:hypothetical protein